MIAGCNQFLSGLGVQPDSDEAVVAIARHYEKLAESMAELGGALEDGVLAAIIGFDAGGPPTIRFARDGSFAYTCELSIRDDQTLSLEGTNYELGIMEPPSPEFARSALRQLGQYYLTTPIGHDQRVFLDEVAGAYEVSGVLRRLNIGIEGYSMYFLQLDGDKVGGDREN